MDRRRALSAASMQSGGGNGLEFPITLIEGDNGELGMKFYKYVKNGQYTDNDIVYLDWRGFLMIHYDWEIDVGGNVASYSYEVIDAYNPQGSARHAGAILYEDGKLIIAM